MVKKLARPEKEKEVQPKRSDSQVDNLWIAPDLAEKMRGPDGSRGLEEVHPTNYIKLADVALKTPAGQPEGEPAEQGREPGANLEKGKSREAKAEPASVEGNGKHTKRRGSAA